MRMLTKVSKSLNRGLFLPAHYLSKLGGFVTALMMLLTVADVVGRKFFDAPMKSAYELSEVMLGFVVFACLAGCEMKDGNVAIELIVSRFRPRVQSVINAFMYVLFFGVSCLLTWRLAVYASNDHSFITTASFTIPISPFIFFASCCCALLSLVVLSRFLLFITGMGKNA